MFTMDGMTGDGVVHTAPRQTYLGVGRGPTIEARLCKSGEVLAALLARLHHKKGRKDGAECGCGERVQRQVTKTKHGPCTQTSTARRTTPYPLCLLLERGLQCPQLVLEADEAAGAFDGGNIVL